MHPGRLFRNSLESNKPLQLVGAINAYCAIQAQKSGFKALYLSGAGVSNYSLGRPDDGAALTLDDILIDAKRIMSVTNLPLFVDVDTGFDDPEKTAHLLSKQGVAGMHMEDQVAAKLCGHLPGKQLVSKHDMKNRIQAALKGKTDPDFVVMARCDALSVEGFDAVIDRSAYYADCGADMIFAEAMTKLAHYKDLKQAINVPLLANITEFGKTELYTTQQLNAHGVDIALYPLSAARAMMKSSQDVYHVLKRDGTQSRSLDKMQRRDDLYATLDYDAKVDQAAQMPIETK